jgi:hypothetical protein
MTIFVSLIYSFFDKGTDSNLAEALEELINCFFSLYFIFISFIVDFLYFFLVY